MSNLLEYKGYLGSVEFSAEDKCLFGKLEFITDLILFEGQSVEEMRAAFEEAVDAYIELCKSEKKEPDQPFKGSFNVRVGESLHRRSAIDAKRTGVTLNEYVKQALEEKLGHSAGNPTARRTDESRHVQKKDDAEAGRRASTKTPKRRTNA
ncbi:type II toxin-antitoxin system HicB family antitoxin [Parapusillimonas sp. SGNA-6]|nr:type II toxin-antitoxin system HicB family antitoxin [Parapusillimonas sp. SGNA-6]